MVAIGGRRPAGDARLRDVVQAGARAVVMIEADGSALARAIGAAARGDALFTDECCTASTTNPRKPRRPILR